MPRTSIRLLCLVAVVALVGAWAQVWFWPRVVSRCGQLTRFAKSGVDLLEVSGVELQSPTRISLGPDGRIWIAERFGLIRILTLREGLIGFRVVHEDVIDAIQQIENHNDDGSPQPQLNTRLITGLAVEEGPTGAIAYVASSDPRIDDADIDSNSGVISLLRRIEGRWVREDLVRGLPRSKADHASNALVVAEDPKRLYVLQGANTNAGAPSSMFFGLPEYALAGAVLEIDLTRVEEPLDLPTLDDEDRPGVRDEHDPFGGNGGKNQAILDPDGPIRIYAVGLRNPYGMVLTNAGLYLTDNGANQDYGGPPDAEEPRRMTNAPAEGGQSRQDSLFLANQRGYDFGHPNPTRSNPGNTFNSSNPQSPLGDARWYAPLTSVVSGAPLARFDKSTNGLVWLDGPSLDPAWRRSLLAVDISGAIHLLRSTSNGGSMGDKELVLQSHRMLLDVAVAESGWVWAIDHGADKLLAIDLMAADRGFLWVVARSVPHALKQFGCSLVGFSQRS